MAAVMYLISAIFVGVGFHKIFAYRPTRVNSYVGGDAYNYIINSNYATGYFVLALLFGVIGSTLLIIEAINEQTVSQKNNLENTQKDANEARKEARKEVEETTNQYSAKSRKK